jgi:hypothetical protein
LFVRLWRGLRIDIPESRPPRVVRQRLTVGYRFRDSLRAKRFYLACAEFIEYPAHSCTMFLPIETVVEAFG